jgi:hypothetical protein
VNNPAADDIFGAGSVSQTTPYSTYSEPANDVSSAASAVVVPEDDGSLFSEIEEAKAAPSPVIPDDSNSGAHYATVDIDDEDKVEHSHSEEKAEAEIKQVRKFITQCYKQIDKLIIHCTFLFTGTITFGQCQLFRD